MFPYFYVTAAEGAEIRSIRGDSSGKFLGEIISDSPQGHFFNVAKVIKARTSAAVDVSTESVVEVILEGGTIAGVTEVSGMLIPASYLRLVSTEYSVDDIEVVLSPNDSDMLETGAASDLKVVLTKNNSRIVPHFKFLAHNGAEYPVAGIDNLQGSQDRLKHKGEAVLLILAKGES
jgi:hypothetical protein